MARGRHLRGQSSRPWWCAPAGAPVTNPLVDLKLLGLERGSLDIALMVSLLALLTMSRIAAFPASIWDQDEAYFAASVSSFDPLGNRPHPPWFPLWIALGKALQSVVGDPSLSLQVVSAVTSVWVVFPLSSLWSAILKRPLAVAAAVVYSLVPGVWLLSARSYTEPAATALLVLTAASWCCWAHRRAALVGSLAAGACLLIRPHLAVAVLPLVVLTALRSHDRRRVPEILLPAGAMLCAGSAWILVSAGGLRPLLAAARTHGSIHFDALAGFEPSLAGLGLARALVSPAVGAGWLLLAVMGAAITARSKPGALAPVLWVLAPLALLVLGISNPEHPRYWLPLLAFSSGLVVVALAHTAGRWSSAILLSCGIAAALVVAPTLSTYRVTPAPAPSATRYAFDRARESGSVVVVDRTLHAFVMLERTQRPFSGTVITDSQIDRGETAPPPAFATVYLRDRNNRSLLLHAEGSRQFTCAQPFLRRLAQDRFVDLEVTTGASLDRHFAPR